MTQKGFSLPQFAAWQDYPPPPVSKGLGGESLKGDKPQLLGEVIKFGKASNLISLLRIKHVYMRICRVPTGACKQTE